MIKCFLIFFLMLLPGYSAEKEPVLLEHEFSTNVSMKGEMIKVYLITWLFNGELNETQCIGEYDDIANKLRVEKELFDVNRNPIYGTKGDLRGRYQYVAGSYYFNKGHN